MSLRTAYLPATTERANHGDLAEQAATHASMDVDIQLASIAHDQAAEMQMAEARKKLGFHGICAGCGETISEARLRAKPHATHCVKCQGRRDGTGVFQS